MKLYKKNNLKSMRRINYAIGILSLLFFQTIIAQEEVTEITSEDTPGLVKQQIKDTIKTSKRIKIDGVAAVVGSYVILESDVDKTLIDIKTQGGDAYKNLSRCELLNQLMKDKLFSHHAIQDSVQVSDTEITNIVSSKVDYLVSQLGTMEKLLSYYGKNDEASFRQELFQIEKGRALAERMQDKVLSEVEITPEEVRQWFNKIPKDQLPVFGAELEISQIVKTPKVSEEETERIVNRLKEMKRDVEENGASFSFKAILNSKDEASRKDGGAYSINKKSPLVKEFKDVAYSLEEGEISDPFETTYGWHILMVEKIRGQELDIRHILLIPKVSDDAMEEAKNELNTIRKRIEEGELTFEEAALNFSDQKETKFEGGKLRNPVNFDTRFELTKMDPKLYNQVRDLKENEISLPVLETNDRTDEVLGYKILKVGKRYDEHVVNFSQDYLKIQELALRDKQQKTLEKWTQSKIKETYISLSTDNKGCNFSSNWLKK
ncbi:peptidylprolyl isomerase [Flavobacteriaceae bacterium R38]|nr:peptidylprolyl isomerase [Flavobacteriaceae bacterium R38]